MTTYRIAEAAEILGVSDDTVRRWIESGRLAASVDHLGTGPQMVDGPELARMALEAAGDPDVPGVHSVSARNRMPGIVTSVKRDTVMAQVEMMCGPFRVVSLLSSEAVDDLGLEPGARAVASVKSTNVILERS